MTDPTTAAAPPAPAMPSVYYEKDGIRLFLGDCREILPTFADQSFDCVVVDPPYGTGGWRRSARGCGSDPSGKLTRESWDNGEVDWLALTRGVPVLTFWPAGRAACLLNAAVKCGLNKHLCLYMRKLDPKPIVGGRTKWSVEPIWVLSRDGFVLLGGDDVWCEASTPRKGRDADATGHPYQKPIEVMRWIISKTNSGTILDPFAGSGTTLRAAKDLGRSAIGIEQDERWCEVAAKRLDQAVLPFTVEQGNTAKQGTFNGF